MSEILDWMSDNILVNFTAMTTVILFFAYFKLNKRQKKAEVGQAEAGVKQSEGGALATMQTTYDEFTKDYKEKWDEIKQEVADLKKSDREKGVIIEDLKRQTKGLTRDVGQLKASLSEVENIACLDIDCLKRQPELGKYKHKKET